MPCFRSTMLYLSSTWSLCLKPQHKSIVCKKKKVFKLMQKTNGTIDCYKARLIAKDFDQEDGVYYNKTFGLVIKTIIISVVLIIFGIAQ